MVEELLGGALTVRSAAGDLAQVPSLEGPNIPCSFLEARKNSLELY